MSKNKTTPHILAYFDILGYKQIINRSDHDDNEFIEGIKSIIEDVFSAKQLTKNAKPKVYTFSDNFIICLEETPMMNKHKILNYLITALQKIQIFAIFDYDIFIRGCIVEGLIYANRNFIYGKGMIDAYKLENEVAIYPRIIIQKKLIESVLDEVQSTYNILKKDWDISETRIISIENFHYILKETLLNIEKEHNVELFDEEEKKDRNPGVSIYLNSPRIYLDFDGQYYTNYLEYMRFWASMEEVTPEMFHDYFFRYGSKICSKLKHYEYNEKVYSKYFWCYQKFIDFIDSLNEWWYLDKKTLQEVQKLPFFMETLLKEDEDDELNDLDEYLDDLFFDDEDEFENEDK